MFDGQQPTAIVEVLTGRATQVAHNQSDTQDGRKNKNAFAAVNPIDDGYDQSHDRVPEQKTHVALFQCLPEACFLVCFFIHNTGRF